jgi:hypothetical protein
MLTSTFGVPCSGRRVARDLVTCFSRRSLVRRRITGSRVTLCITRGLIAAIPCRPVRQTRSTNDLPGHAQRRAVSPQR